MDSSCRLCAAQSSSLTSVFSLKSGRVVVDLITIICPIKIEINDSLPQQICSICLKIVIDAVKLREKSIQSDINFRSNEIQQHPEAIVIKKELDPIQSIFFETENKIESECDSSEDNGDEDYFPIVNYEPKAKKSRDEFTCEYCGRKFSTKSHHTKHVRDAHEGRSKSQFCNRPAQCPICDTSVSQRKNLSRHIRRYHDESLSFKCDRCTYRFASEARLKTHEFKEHIQKPQEEILEMEIKRHLKSELDESTCNECGESFEDRDSLVSHIKRAHRIVSGFRCEFCDSIFSKTQSLHRHYQRIHLNELQHSCSECDKKFINAQILYRHFVKFHEKCEGDVEISSRLPKPPQGEQNDEICKFCNQNFNANLNGSKYRYERHLVTMHEAEFDEIFHCDVCGKKFIHFNSMRMHMDIHRKRIREEDYPIKCSQCSRRFINEEKLQTHMTTQHNQTKTICHICGKIFQGSKGTYETHMKRHNDIRDFQCHQCPMRFVLPRGLERHLTTHSKDRPFMCTNEGCGMSFKSKDILRRHMKKACWKTKDEGRRNRRTWLNENVENSSTFQF